MGHVLSMRLAGRSALMVERTSGPQADPVRRIVQSLLVVYLSPAILAVLLIGGVAVAGSWAISAARECGHRLFAGNDEAGQPAA